MTAGREETTTSITETAVAAQTYQMYVDANPGAVSDAIAKPEAGRQGPGDDVHRTDATELPSVDHFREVIEPERPVHALDGVNDPRNLNIEVSTLAVTDPGDETQGGSRQAGQLPTEQYPLGEEGVSGGSDCLAEHLALC